MQKPCAGAVVEPHDKGVQPLVGEAKAQFEEVCIKARLEQANVEHFRSCFALVRICKQHSD